MTDLTATDLTVSLNISTNPTALFQIGTDLQTAFLTGVETDVWSGQKETERLRRQQWTSRLLSLADR